MVAFTADPAEMSLAFDEGTIDIGVLQIYRRDSSSGSLPIARQVIWI